MFEWLTVFKNPSEASNPLRADKVCPPPVNVNQNVATRNSARRAPGASLFFLRIVFRVGLRVVLVIRVLFVVRVLFVIRVLLVIEL